VCISATPFTVCDPTTARCAMRQGLTLSHFRAQLEDLQDASLASKLNLSTSGPHPRVDLGYMGNRVSLS
jgi:hypothetical protein